MTISCSNKSTTKISNDTKRKQQNLYNESFNDKISNGIIRHYHLMTKAIESSVEVKTIAYFIKVYQDDRGGFRPVLIT